MSIYSRTVVRGCGLVGGVLLLLLLLSPTMSYRLQSQQQNSISSKSTQQQNHSQQNHNNATSRASSIGSPWPPRIPLWGFLPSSAASTSSSYSSSSNHPNSINNNHAVANSLNAKPSKRESSPSASHKGLNANHHLNSNMVDPHRPHHFSPLDTFDDGEIDDNLLFDDGSSSNDDDDAWLVNLKRSSNIGQQRSGVKRNRIYDVPQIECPPAEDGMERFACPTPDKLGRYPCVDDHVLCDGFVDCPGREDEDRQACMFYKTTKAHLDVLADALLRWARGRR